jgi:hypothetical protein
MSREQRVLIKYLREEGHGSTQKDSKLVEQYGDKALSSPILISPIGCRSVARREKVLKIRDAAEDRKISKHLSESREHAKHRPVLQFETLLRRPALLRQWYYMSSLKFFIWNVVTGDGSPTN